MMNSLQLKGIQLSWRSSLAGGWTITALSRPVESQPACSARWAGDDSTALDQFLDRSRHGPQRDACGFSDGSLIDSRKLVRVQAIRATTPHHAHRSTMGKR